MNNFPTLPETIKNLVIVSAEAGGAQILSSWIKRNAFKKYNIKFILENPAHHIFEYKLHREIENDKIDILKYLDPESSYILTGTSRSRELERDAIKLAKTLGIRVASVLDHWTNYRERFVSYDQWTNLPDTWIDQTPDEVWCADPYCYQMAIQLGFEPAILREYENPYFQDIKDDWKRISSEPSNIDRQSFRILYICEEIAHDMKAQFGDEYHWGFTEFDLAKDLVTFANSWDKKQNLEIRFRTHPNEPKDKYDSVIGSCVSIKKSTDPELLNELKWADIVIGGESMALVVTLLTGKTAISFYPDNAKHKCVLPHVDIQHITRLEEIFSLYKSSFMANNKTHP